MKKRIYWGTLIVIVLLLGVAIWWLPSELNDRKDPLNKEDAFVYTNNATLYWFEFTSRRGKVEGTLYEQKLIAESGKDPYTEDKEYPVTGKTTEKGYEFQVKVDGEITTYDAWFSGPHLSVQKQGESENILYNPVNQKELDEYKEALLDYYVEENENKKIRKFFSELRSVYGYLYSSEDSSFQLFIKIDEALLEGELAGSLLKLDDNGKETKYALNGITDGNNVRLFTTVNGKETKLEGNFYNDATGFDLSFWTTDQKLPFQAVTEEEFKQVYEEFKSKAE